MPLSIRPATRADLPLILSLIRELAEYEREPHAVEATIELLDQHLFGESIPARSAGHDPSNAGARRGPAAECVIGELDGAPEGFALWFHNFSTWKGKPGLYLEDLFVRPAARGRGLGTALLRHLARIAVERGCARMEWSVLDWNAPAIEFYKAHGAMPMSEWTVFRVSGEELARLASNGSTTA